MECWHCERPSHAVCRFCGRMVCKDHVQTMPYLVDTYVGKDGVHRAIVVADSIWCGVCEPKEDPIPLPDLE